MQCRVPVLIVMSLGAVVSIVVSFCGGYLLYLESLERLQETMAALSEADTVVSAQAISRAFDEAGSHSRAFARLFVLWSPPSLGALQRYLSHDILVRTVNSVSMWSIGVKYIPMVRTLGNATALLQWAWWDPLTDPEHVALSGGPKLWVEGYYLPAFWAHPSCAPPAGEYAVHNKYCALAQAVDPNNGIPLYNTYNWSDSSPRDFAPGGKWDHLQVDWQRRGSSWWTALHVWASEDGTPLVYATHHRVLPELRSHPLFVDVKLVVSLYVTPFGWPGVLRALRTEAALVVCALHDGLNSQVLATNRNDTLVPRRCTSQAVWAGDAGDCVAALHDMDPTVQDAARSLNNTPPDTFQRHRISGGEHWLRRRVIFSAVPGRDELPTLWLLWVHPVDQIQSKADDSLLVFILFILGVAVFDFGILGAEILQLGLPLRRLVVAVARTDGMNIDAVRAELARVDSGCCMVAELAAVAKAFRASLAALQVYKEFLPEVCLPHDEAEEAYPDVPDVVPPGSGKVCIAFTDIQSSTELWSWRPQLMHDTLRLHNKVVRSVAAAHHGYEVKVIGDAFMLAFPTARDGVRFALELQEALVRAPWHPELLRHDLCRRQAASDHAALWCGLRVRIGLNYGDVLAEMNPVTRRQDYFGTAVTIAARVEPAVGYGGLIGATAAVLTACGTLSELGDPVVIPRGAVSLKGVQEPIPIHVVLPAGLAGRRSLLHAPDASREAAARGSVMRSRPSSAAGSRRSPSPRARECNSPPEAWTPRRPFRVSTACVRCALPEAHPVEELLPQLLRAVELGAESTQGAVHCVCSSFAVVVWNAAGHCPNHIVQAYHFAAVVTLPGFARGIPCHFGGSCGLVLAGSIAAARRRHSVVVGGCVEFAVLLAAEAEQSDCDALMDGALAECGTRAGSVAKVQLWEADGCEAVVWEFVLHEDALESTLSIWNEDEDHWGGLVSRWDPLLRHGATDLEDIVPHQLFLDAARGAEGAAARLRIAADAAPGDARIAAMLRHLAAGSLCTRLAPPSVFFLHGAQDC